MINGYISKWLHSKPAPSKQAAESQINANSIQMLSFPTKSITNNGNKVKNSTKNKSNNEKFKVIQEFSISLSDLKGKMNLKEDNRKKFNTPRITYSKTSAHKPHFIPHRPSSAISPKLIFASKRASNNNGYSRRSGDIHPNQMFKHRPDSKHGRYLPDSHKPSSQYKALRGIAPPNMSFAQESRSSYRRYKRPTF